MKKKIISLMTLMLCVTLASCNVNTTKSVDNNSNNNNDQINSTDSGNNYGGDTNTSETPIPSSNPIISSEVISSSIANSDSSNEPVVVTDPLDQIIADFVSDLNVSVPSVKEYNFDYAVFYYYAYQTYVISMMCDDNSGSLADNYAKGFTADTNLVSMNDDDYYPVSEAGYLYTDSTNGLFISFYSEDGYFIYTILRYDGLYGTLDVSEIDTNWYVDYVNLEGYTILDKFPSTQIKDMLGIITNVDIPSSDEDIYPALFQEAYVDDEDNYYPNTFYVVLEGNQMEPYVNILQKAGYTAEVVENIGETIDWDTFEFVEYTYYTAYGYDANKNIYISIVLDDNENTLISFNKFEDLFSTSKTTNTDWTDKEKALMNSTLHQVLPFMAFGNDYDLYDASDDDWTLLVLEDSYFEDLTEDYINLLLNEGFFIDDVTWDDTYYCYDNGYVYIEIYIAYEYGGNYLEIYYEPTHLGTLDSLSLNINQLDIVAGVSYQLEPIYNPETAKYPTTWSSSDNNVATVDNNGLVTIKNDASINSSVTITASTAVGKTASCTFNIKENKVTGLLFDKENYDVTPGGKKVSVSYTLLPYGVTTNEQVNFSINPNNAGILFDAGAMSLKAEETAVIGTVVTLKGSINEYEATATVTVISSEISHTLDRDFFGIQKSDYSVYKSYKKTTDEGATYDL